MAFDELFKSACASLERDGGNFAPLRRHRVSQSGPRRRGDAGVFSGALRRGYVARTWRRWMNAASEFGCQPRSNDFRAREIGSGVQTMNPPILSLAAVQQLGLLWRIVKSFYRCRSPSSVARS